MKDLSRSTVDLADGTALNVVAGAGADAGADAGAGAGADGMGGRDRVLVYIHAPGGLEDDLSLLNHLSVDLALYAPDLTSFRSMDDVPMIQRQCSEMMALLGLQRPMLAGHGAGAAVAAELAAAAPDDFDHLILIAPLGMDADQRPISGEGMENRLAHIHARTTLIRGKQDEIVTNAAILNLARLLPNSALITVPEAGHDVVNTRTDAVARGFRHGMRISGGAV